MLTSKKASWKRESTEYTGTMSLDLLANFPPCHPSHLEKGNRLEVKFRDLWGMGCIVALFIWIENLIQFWRLPSKHQPSGLSCKSGNDFVTLFALILQGKVLSHTYQKSNGAIILESVYLSFLSAKNTEELENNSVPKLALSLTGPVTWNLFQATSLMLSSLC